jgi:hypothetical protein
VTEPVRSGILGAAAIALEKIVPAMSTRGLEAVLPGTNRGQESRLWTLIQNL